MSHGYVYKQSSIDCREVVGKRILCSNRHGRTGCGRTRQLYLADVIPRRQYHLSIVIAFIQTLLAGTGVEKAYLNAIGSPSGNPRHAWRWLKDLYQQLAQWRTLVSPVVETFIPPQPSKRLKVLLPTLKCLFNSARLSSIHSIQCYFQRAFF